MKNPVLFFIAIFLYASSAVAGIGSPPYNPAAVAITGGTINNISTGLIANSYGLYSSSTAPQTGFATETCVTGSVLALIGSPVVGTRYKFTLRVSKTAAGTAAATVKIIFGYVSCGTGLANIAFTLPAQTAVADNAVLVVDAVYRAAGASSVFVGGIQVQHSQAAAGFINQSGYAAHGLSGAFNSTTGGGMMYIWLNGGASAAWTVESVEVTAGKLN